jgi:four helix bundle protein
MLAYEKLDVYRCATEFLALVTEMAKEAQKGDGPLIDQLRRASMSIPPNIAESAGRTGAPDRAKFFSIARGSAMECNAILDVCRIQGRFGDEAILKGKELLVRIVGMLTKLCR